MHINDVLGIFGAIVVLAIVAAHFGVNDFSQIQRKNYDYIIRYLLDMKPKEMLN